MMNVLKKFIRKIFQKRSILLLCLTHFIFSSCSSVNYINDGKFKSSLTANLKHHYPIIIKRNLEFYFWGLVPKNFNIDLSKLIEDEGYTSNISNVKIKEYQTLSQTFKQFFTLGMYIPKTIEVSGFVKLH